MRDEDKETLYKLEGSKFRFAKTMPENPHHYTLRETWDSDEDFDRAVIAVREHGEVMKYKGRDYTCLSMNGFLYWSMGAPVKETILINRKKLDEHGDYDKIADFYDDLFLTSEDKLFEREIMNMLTEMFKVPVLDIGCGTGLVLEYFNPVDYDGVDPSKKMLDVLIEHYGTPNHTLFHCKYEDFVPHRKYGSIISLFGSFNYINPECIMDVKESLADDGQAFIMLYAGDYYPVTYERAHVEFQHNETKEYIPYLERVGAKVVKHKTYLIARF